MQLLLVSFLCLCFIFASCAHAAPLQSKSSRLSSLMHSPELQALIAHQASKINPYLKNNDRPRTQPSHLPTNFDGRQAWPGCIGKVLNQGACGSCWAFASTEVLSDRFCIESGGKVRVTLSPQNLLSCEVFNLGCTMGSLPFWAFQFLQGTGVTTLECSPYVSGRDGTVPKCTDSAKQCANSSEPFRLYKAANYTQVGSFWNPAGHIEAIMEALLHGPVDATFNVWSDFDEYSGGVYRYRHGTYEGLHSVKVIGYGVETSEDGTSARRSTGSCRTHGDPTGGPTMDTSRS